MVGRLLKVVILLIVDRYIFIATAETVALDDNPSLFPGHMEPLGAKQLKTEIETLQEFPSPETFFEEYIKPRRPFLVKQGAINQRAYKFWSDDYMKGFPEAKTEFVAVEPNLKEVREAEGFTVSLHEFIERYHNEFIYMVNKVPSFLQKDVTMPPPLQCNNTRELMLDHVTWMSSGGTKSVLHTDDLDNINCLFRGSKDLLFINPTKFAGKVPLDHPNGAYSSIDVEKVNFTKYPSLREVEYIQCHMEEGDCLFIPWRWYHQVNSRANDNKQNIAVNIWFKHDPNHKPANCQLPEEKSSLDQFSFKGMPGQDENNFPLISLWENMLRKTKYKRANLNTFYTILHKVPGIFSQSALGDHTLPVQFDKLALEMFNRLNVNGDKYITKDDFDQLFDDGESVAQLESWIGMQMNNMREMLEQDAAKDQVELLEEGGKEEL